MAYKQLDYYKRCQIAALWKAGYKQVEIAQEVGVHKSTISRELRNNISFVRTALGSWQYKPDYAQAAVETKRKAKPKRIKLTDEVKSMIREKIKADWSPEQISGHAKRHGLFGISHEAIYRFILQDKRQGGTLYLHLRHQHKKYRKRYGSPPRTGPIKNRRFIDERPKIVDEKTRLGDWEIDTIIGKGHQGAIVTIVERFSRKTLISLVGTKHAHFVREQTIHLLSAVKNHVWTITADNVLTLESRVILEKKTSYSLAA